MTWRRVPQGIVAAAIAMLPHAARAQVEFDAGIGMTLLDRQAAIGNGSLATSRQLAYGADARIFLLSLGPVRLGAEAGYHYLWSYQAVYGTTLVQRDIDADYVSLVARVPTIPHVALDVGCGLHLFDGFTDVSMHAAVRYYAAVNPQLDFGIGGRADLVLDAVANMLPVVLTVGFSLKP